MLTIILRHRRENLKKCSLSGLENRSDLRFFTYPPMPDWENMQMPDLSSYLMLKIGAEPLTPKDADRPLLLIDGTWRLAARMQRQCPQMEGRSLPGHFRTAYPRRQTDCLDPEKGLSSIEALYLAHLILKRSPDDLLDHYRWKNEFLQCNRLI